MQLLTENETLTAVNFLQLSKVLWNKWRTARIHFSPAVSVQNADINLKLRRLVHMQMSFMRQWRVNSSIARKDVGGAWRETVNSCNFHDAKLRVTQENGSDLHPVGCFWEHCCAFSRGATALTLLSFGRLALFSFHCLNWFFRA